MKKLAKWLLVIFTVMAIVLVILVYNPGLLKGPLERYLSDLAGYSISLEGDLDLELGRHTGLTARNIHVSGPDWASHHDLIDIGHLEVALVTASIFEKILVLESLAVDKLELNLETDANGKGNWITANKSPAPDGEENDSEEKPDPIVIFRNIEISDTKIAYRNGKTGIDHLLKIDSLKQHQQADGMLHTTLQGDLNERLIDYTGSIGPYVNLLNGRDISFTADGRFGDLIIKSAGLIDDLMEPRRPTFRLDMQGPDIDEITAMLGTEDLGSGGFTLRANGTEVDDHYEADISGKVGDISLNTSVQASDLSQMNELDLVLAINGPSLGTFTRVFGIENWPDKPFSLSADVERVGGTLNIGDLTLNIGGTKLMLDALLTNFPNYDASRVKLSITGDDIVQFRELLGLPGMAIGPFEINGKLDVTQEEVELVQVNMKTSLGQASLSGTLGAGPDYIGSKLHLHLDGENARSFISIVGIDALPEQPFNLNIRFELVENGLLVDRSVLATIEDDRLELGGFIAFNPGIEGSDLNLRISGDDLSQILQRVVETTELPSRPYDLRGQVKVLDNSLQLENVELDFEGIKLGTTGSVNFADQLAGTALEFQINGEDFSSLGKIEAIGDSLGIFVPGQVYQAAGRLTAETNGWRFSDVNGRIGQTGLGFDGLISHQPGLAGSKVSFSIKGPGLDQLLVNSTEPGLPDGAFETSGQVTLTKDSLIIDKLNFETDRFHARTNLDLGWPVSSSIDVGFNVNISGNDIRYLVPETSSFEPHMAAFKLEAAGRKRGRLMSLQQFDADIGNLQVKLIGEISDDPAKENADVSFSLVSEDISKLGRLHGEDLPAIALDLKTDFKGDAGQFVLPNLNVSLGDSRLEAFLDVSLNGPKPQLKLQATSSYIDIRPFLGPADEDEAGDEDIESESRERLIPATPLPLEALAAADLLLNVNIAELHHRKDSIRNLVLETELKSGRLDVSEFSYKAPLGNFRTSFSIQPTGANQADVEMDLTAEKLVLNISGLPREKLQQIPSINLDFHASGKGGNLQEVAGSINGSLYLESAGGTLEGVNLSILDTFILDEIFGLIMPKSDDKGLIVTCVAWILKIENGLIKTDPALAFTTNKIAVVNKGTLDLKTEKMNFNFNATPTNALKISAGELFNPYILIAGTLSKPEVGIDPSKALLHGGAAIGTAGISILAKGFIDRVGNAMPVCEAMQKQVRLEINPDPAK